MKTPRKSLVPLAAVAALLLAGASADAAFPQYPQFDLYSIDGSRHISRELRGKAVLIQFFSRLCKPCRAEVPFINSLHKNYPDTLQVLGIGWGENDRESFLKLTEDWGIDYPVCPDPDGRVVGAFLGDTVMLPHSVLLDPRGRFVRDFAGLHKSINRQMENSVRSLEGPVIEYRKRGPSFFIGQITEKDGAKGAGPKWAGKIKSWLAARKIPVAPSIEGSDYSIDGNVSKTGAEIEIVFFVKSRAGAVETSLKHKITDGGEKEIERLFLKQLEIFPYLGGRK